MVGILYQTGNNKNNSKLYENNANEEPTKVSHTFLEGKIKSNYFVLGNNKDDYDEDEDEGGDEGDSGNYRDKDKELKNIVKKKLSSNTKKVIDSNNKRLDKIIDQLKNGGLNLNEGHEMQKIRPLKRSRVIDK